MKEEIDALTELIIGAAIRVHRKYGAGLLESVYNLALALELVALGALTSSLMSTSPSCLPICA
jgi:GxxExxY protein